MNRLTLEIGTTSLTTWLITELRALEPSKHDELLLRIAKIDRGENNGDQSFGSKGMTLTFSGKTSKVTVDKSDKQMIEMMMKAPVALDGAQRKAVVEAIHDLNRSKAALKVATAKADPKNK